MFSCDTSKQRETPALSPTDSSWSIRNLLNPVVTRLLIHGVDPFDLERVLRRVESTPLRNARQLDTTWIGEWEAHATAWQERAEQASRRGCHRSALDLGLAGATCRLAQFLVNPGDIERRRALYFAYAKSYRFATDHYDAPVLSVQVPIGSNASLAAVLHLPRTKGPHPCVVILAGLGSCKEEMNTLARYAVDRGLAALVPDMPGNGETLFRFGLNCGPGNISKAFAALVEFVDSRPELDAQRVGVQGLCMGGGYACRACVEQTRFRWCAALFPLFVDQVDNTHTPQWMKCGDWYELQTGGMHESALFHELGWREDFTITCPFFMAHSKHDNWMTLDRAQLLYDQVTASERQLLLIEQEPVFSSGHAMTHTMPVGEQLRWVGPLMADWMIEQSRRSVGE